MNNEIIEVNQVGVRTISFKLKVTEPISGQSNIGSGFAHLDDSMDKNLTEADLITLVKSASEYGSMIAQLSGPLWKYATAAAPVTVPIVTAPLSLIEQKIQMSDSVDLLVARICNKFTRFQMGYEQREAAAKAYQSNGYSGDPTTWIARFADNTGMSYKAATDRILQQAALFRSSLMQLENLRMDKYIILQAPNLADAQSAYDAIVAACNDIDRKLA